MLNELMSLHQTLQEIGVGVTVRHPDIKPLAKRPVLHVLLDRNSGIAAVNVISSELATKFWTVRDGKHNSFPQISLKKDPKNPANDQAVRVMLTLEERQKLAAARKEAARFRLLDEYRTFHPIDLSKIVHGDRWPGDGHRRRIQERAETIGRSGKAPGFVELSRRFLAADSVQMLVEIEHQLYLRLATDADKESLDVAAALSYEGGCNFLFDCEADTSGFVAVSPEAAAAVSLGLAAADGTAARAAGDRIRDAKCALTGSEEPLVDDKFPEANFAREKRPNALYHALRRHRAEFNAGKSKTSIVTASIRRGINSA